MKISHRSNIMTPETPPTEEIPRVQLFIGICTEMYLPIRFTANKAQIPCKAVNSKTVKNLFDLK